MNKLPTLSARTQMYLQERRRLGFELRRMGYALHSFARYVDKLDFRQPLTVEVMAKWARQDHGHSDDPRTWARRLMILRPFTRWLRQFEPRTEIPEEAIFGRIGERCRRTYTKNRRSSICWRRRAAWVRLQVCAVRPMRRCLV